MKKDKLEEEIENYGLEEHQKIALYNFIKHKLLSQRKEDFEWVLNKIEFIENNSNWNCVTLKKEIEKEMKK